jgi:hypothetical protein
VAAIGLAAVSAAAAQTHAAAERPRAREAGIVIGTLPTGPRNAIVDVPSVRVGHATVIEGDRVRTGSPRSCRMAAISTPIACPRRCSSQTATASCSA